jgi:hypothetical protein
MTLVFLKTDDDDDGSVAVDICRDLAFFVHPATCSALLPQRSNQQRQTRGNDDDDDDAYVIFMYIVKANVVV